MSTDWERDPGRPAAWSFLEALRSMMETAAPPSNARLLRLGRRQYGLALRAIRGPWQPHDSGPVVEVLGVPVEQVDADNFVEIVFSKPESATEHGP